MFVIAFTRKLGKLLRGSAAGRQIFLAALVGLLLGMTPGMNLTVLLLLVLALVSDARPPDARRR